MSWEKIFDQTYYLFVYVHMFYYFIDHTTEGLRHASSPFQPQVKSKNKEQRSSILQKSSSSVSTLSIGELLQAYPSVNLRAILDIDIYVSYQTWPGNAIQHLKGDDRL